MYLGVLYVMKRGHNSRFARIERSEKRERRCVLAAANSIANIRDSRFVMINQAHYRRMSRKYVRIKIIRRRKAL